MAADAFAKQDVEFSGLEWRCDLVFDHLDLGFVADGFFALFDGAGAADVQAHRSVELQRVAAGGGLGRAEHHADLHADLVDEDHHAVGFLDVRGEFAQGLAHQAGLQAGQRVAHFAFQLGPGCECGHRVDDDQVHRARAHQAVNDFQRLLAGIGLADQQVLQVDAQLLCVLDVQRVFSVHEGALAALALHFGDHLQRQRGFAGGLRPVNFDHPSARQTAYAQGNIQAQRAGGDDLDVFNDFAFAQAHDGAFAELLLNLGQRDLQGFGFFRVGGKGFDGCVHAISPEVGWVKTGASRCLMLSTACMLEQHCMGLLSIFIEFISQFALP